VLGTNVSRAKTAEPIEMSFGKQSPLGQSNQIDVPDVQKVNLKKSKMTDGCHFEKR